MAHTRSTCGGSVALFGRKRLAGEVISDGKGSGIAICGGRERGWVGIEGVGQRDREQCPIPDEEQVASWTRRG
jgi:hypothetical protein